MLSAKSRERKCSTCKHYQPSPLWRKGWCRNPLLYDRNTNHLVEADSLACNRTFIDYWEPATEGVGPAGTPARGTKPRIAPSIPMDPTDASGSPSDGPRSTPAGGLPKPVEKTPFRPTAPLAVPGRKERPPLTLVDEDYDDLDEIELGSTATMPAAQRTTRSGEPAGNALSRIREGKGLRRPTLGSLSGAPLYGAVGALAVVAVLLAAFLIFGNRNTESPPATPQPTGVAGALPTATGFGDPTPSSQAQSTSIAIAPSITGTIAVGGFVEVGGTGDGLIVRRTPGGERVTKISDGTKARVVDGPQEANGFQWWKIDQFDRSNPALTGWCAAEYLKPTPP